VGEGVLADDRLVEPDLQAGDRRDHPAHRVEPHGLDDRRQAVEVLARLRAMTNSSSSSSPALADPVDRALVRPARDLPGAARPGSAAPPGRPAGPGGRDGAIRPLRSPSEPWGSQGPPARARRSVPAWPVTPPMGRPTSPTDRRRARCCRSRPSRRWPPRYRVRAANRASMIEDPDALRLRITESTRYDWPLKSPSLFMTFEAWRPTCRPSMSWTPRHRRESGVATSNRTTRRRLPSCVATKVGRDILPGPSFATTEAAGGRDGTPCSRRTPDIRCDRDVGRSPVDPSPSRSSVPAVLNANLGPLPARPRRVVGRIVRLYRRAAP
jgi:hypothetical protein